MAGADKRLRSGEVLPVGEGEVLGAGVGIEVLGDEAGLPGGLGAVWGGEISSELLAGVAEAAASQGEGGGGDLGGGAWGEDDDLAVDLGWRGEFAGGDDRAELDGGEVLGEE